MSTYTTITIEEFSEEAIKGAFGRIGIDPPTDIDYKKFLENTETTIAYLLEREDQYEELGTSVKVHTSVYKKHRGCGLEIRFDYPTKKIKVTMASDPYKEEGSFCFISCVTDQSANYKEDLSKKPRKVPLDKLPILLSTDLKYFAKSKLQGLL